jgi:hypothetical protein
MRKGRVFALLAALGSFAVLASFPQEPLAVSISTDRGAGAAYTPGEPLVLFVEVSKEAWLYVYHVDGGGRARLLWPDPRAARTKLGVAWPVGPMRVPGVLSNETLFVEGPTGLESIVAVASTRPLAFSDKILPLAEWPEASLPSPPPRWLTPAELYPPERAVARADLRIVEPGVAPHGAGPPGGGGAPVAAPGSGP